MPTLRSLAATAVVALSLCGATTLPAAADVQGGDKFRVVGLTGAQTLKLMAGPARWAGLTTDVPFDARNLRATGVRQGHWLQLSFRQSNGDDMTGWAETQFLAADDLGEATVYQVVNVGRRQSVPLMSYDGYGVRARIPGYSTVLPACGPCQNGYCQVRYQTRRGPLDGLVEQTYLAIARPADPGFSLVEERGPGTPAPRQTYGISAQIDDNAQPAFADAPSVDLLPPPRDHGWFNDPGHRINWLYGN